MGRVQHTHLLVTMYAHAQPDESLIVELKIVMSTNYAVKQATCNP